MVLLSRAAERFCGAFGKYRIGGPDDFIMSSSGWYWLDVTLAVEFEFTVS